VQGRPQLSRTVRATTRAARTHPRLEEGPQALVTVVAARSRSHRAPPSDPARCSENAGSQTRGLTCGSCAGSVPWHDSSPPRGEVSTATASASALRQARFRSEPAPSARPWRGLVTAAGAPSGRRGSVAGGGAPSRAAGGRHRLFGRKGRRLGGRRDHVREAACGEGQSICRSEVRRTRHACSVASAPGRR